MVHDEPETHQHDGPRGQRRLRFRSISGGTTGLSRSMSDNVNRGRRPTGSGKGDRAVDNSIRPATEMIRPAAGSLAATLFFSRGSAVARVEEKTKRIGT